MGIKVSLIVATYDRADQLALVLESLLRQSYMPFEVLITEDGQNPSIKSVCDSFKSRAPFQVLHLTQADLGNRKPLALNKAILASQGEYLVFVDGDCVLQRDFIKAHVELSGETHFLTGRRVELSQKISTTLTEQNIREGCLDGISWTIIWDGLMGQTRGWKRMFRTPHFLRAILKRDEIDDIRGCNFSVHKKHLVAINGFSNDFSGAYGEDSDVEHRLKFLGLKMKGNKGAAIQFHLWHKEQVKDLENQKLLSQLQETKNYVTANGLKESARIQP